MAKCKAAEDISVAVVVDGQPLKEYELKGNQNGEGPRDNKIQRYIEVQLNTLFQVHLNFDKCFKRTGYGLVLRLDVDGERADSRVHTTQSLRAKKSSIFKGFYSQTPTGYKVHPFRFGTLNRTNETLAESEHALINIKALGEIKFGIWRTKYVKMRKQDDPPNYDHEPPNFKELPESLLKGKAISARVLRDPPIQQKKGTRCTLNRIDKEEEPYLEFSFLFRTRHDLQSEGILTLPPSPEPLQSDSTSVALPVQTGSVGQKTTGSMIAKILPLLSPEQLKNAISSLNPTQVGSMLQQLIETNSQPIVTKKEPSGSSSGNQSIVSRFQNTDELSIVSENPAKLGKRKRNLESLVNMDEDEIVDLAED